MLAHVVRHRGAVLRRLEPMWRLLAMMGAAVVVFVVAMPAVLVEPSKVWNGISRSGTTTDPGTRG